MTFPYLPWMSDRDRSAPAVRDDAVTLTYGELDDWSAAIKAGHWRIIEQEIRDLGRQPEAGSRRQRGLISMSRGPKFSKGDRVKLSPKDAASRYDLGIRIARTSSRDSCV